MPHALQVEAQCASQLEQQARTYTAELEAARSAAESERAGAAARLQSMAQEWRERCQALQDRLQESEGATQALVAAHEKTLSKMTAQNSRKVRFSRYTCPCGSHECGMLQTCTLWYNIQGFHTSVLCPAQIHSCGESASTECSHKL